MPKASPEMLEAVAKAAELPGIPPTITRHEPLGGPRGAKVVVVSRAPITQVGSIIVPGVAQTMEHDGWIIAASRDVGSADNSPLWEYLYGDESQRADGVMGLHVTWGKFTGTVLPAGEGPSGEKWEGRFLLMVEADLLTVIGKVEA